MQKKAAIWRALAADRVQPKFIIERATVGSSVAFILILEILLSFKIKTGGSRPA